VDLSGMWALPAAMATTRSDLLIRALDAKGRLQLPVTAPTAMRLPAEWGGALVTVFLSGSDHAPRPAFVTDALRLDARGRLTLSAGVRRQAGIPDGGDVLATVDAGRHRRRRQPPARRCHRPAGRPAPARPDRGGRRPGRRRRRRG
jgi:hypothetical protein